MTRYNYRPEEDPDWVGDEYDTLGFGSAEGYRDGVNAVIEWVEREGLASARDIRNAIELGEI